jgi:hypothetical protein
MIKNALWNALSILVFIAIIAVIAVFALLFFNPTSGLNPFPPPTQPVALNLPTFTPTFEQLPPTWTPGNAELAVAGQTLKPSSTPLETDALVVLYTKTRVPTSTPTATPTRTATETPDSTQTRTETPHLTNTALALIATNAVQTAQAKTMTASAMASGPEATQTVEAMPPNPSSANEVHGTSNDTWQDLVSDPSFSWLAVSGASGYYVYWGSNATGTSTTKVSSAAYNPSAVTVGTYYLRLRTIFPWGERPDWTTVFTFRFDDTNPTAPSAAVETNGSSSGTWQNSVPDPAFTWSGATDTGSGVGSYDVYFGSNPNGTFVVASPSSAAYDPPALSTGTFYLRVRSLDYAGNKSGWVTLFVFRYDGTPPDQPGSLSRGGTTTDPEYTWSASSDAHSGFSTYEIFWGSGTSCGAKNQPDQTGTSFAPATITEGGDYTFCVRAKDNAGNVSGWAKDTFTYTP